MPRNKHKRERYLQKQKERKRFKKKIDKKVSTAVNPDKLPWMNIEG